MSLTVSQPEWDASNHNLETLNPNGSLDRTSTTLLPSDSVPTPVANDPGPRVSAENAIAPSEKVQAGPEIISPADSLLKLAVNADNVDHNDNVHSTETIQSADVAPTNETMAHPYGESQIAETNGFDLLESNRHVNSQAESFTARGGPSVTINRRGRGGRKPHIKVEPPPEELGQGPSNDRKVNRGGRPRGSRAGISSARGSSRGGRPRGSRAGISSSTSGRGLKRKRKHERRGDDDDEDDEDSEMLSSTSEEITALPSQSRSGRRITQASSFSPLPFTPSPSQPSLNEHLLAPTSTPSNHASSAQNAFQHKISPTKVKRKRVTASAVCLNCLRGHSPQTNQIVFCDTCNTPYHQHCHDPPISPSILELTDSEWHCADCALASAEASFLVNRTPAPDDWSLAEKRRYLEGLEKNDLISLLLSATSIIPNFPLVAPDKFDPSNNSIIDPTATAMSTNTTTGAVTADNITATTIPSTNHAPGAAAAAPLPQKRSSSKKPTPDPPTGIVAAITREAALASVPLDSIFHKSLEFEYPESEHLPYPRAGNGIVLPPEGDDLDILVDEDVVTYSHSWLQSTMSGAAWIGAMGDAKKDVGLGGSGGGGAGGGAAVGMVGVSVRG